MSSSWSDLPLDLLITIKNKLQSEKWFDISSFRLVCTQWRSIAPAPDPLPCYNVSYSNSNNRIYFRSENNKSRSIPWPSLFQYPVIFLCSSNGWLAFLTQYDETLYLFDPVSNLKLIFPPISLSQLYHYRDFEPTLRDTSHHIHISKVVVSCVEDDIAVGCIVFITSRATLLSKRRLAFCRYDNDPKWSLLMEESKEITGIALADDGRFYAVSEDWVLYMIDERPPMVRLKKFKLVLSDHVLAPFSMDDPIYSNGDPTETMSIEMCYNIEGSGESELKIFGCLSRSWNGGTMIYFKLDVRKLHGSINGDNIACEVERCFEVGPSYCSTIFIPFLGERSLKVEVENKG